MQSLAQSVTDQTSLQHGFEVGLWTLSILRALIRRQFGHIFLQRLMLGATNPVFRMVDGHRVHKSKQVREYVERQVGKLQLFLLLPYSPLFNPDKQVWAHVKQRVSS